MKRQPFDESDIRSLLYAALYRTDPYAHHVPKSNGTPGMTFYERSEDDATMVIFDVVSIDLENRKVLFTRFGAGEDREIQF